MNYSFGAVPKTLLSNLRHSRFPSVFSSRWLMVLCFKYMIPGDRSHEIKRHLLLGRKVVTNLDSILKSRDITLPTKVRLVRLCFFQRSCMDVRVELWRKLSAEELMLLNCGVGEDSWESLGLQGDPTRSNHCKGDQPWVFFGRTDAEA